MPGWSIAAFSFFNFSAVSVFSLMTDSLNFGPVLFFNFHNALHKDYAAQ